MSKQERAARTRHALISSAAELFEQRGYVQSRLSEISAGAGVSPGALHFHFENKAAVADAVESAAFQCLRRTARRADGSGAGALQTLTDLSHALACLLRCDVVVRAGFRLNCDAARRSGPNIHREWQDCVRQLLSRAADEGSLAPGISQQDLTVALVAATTGLEVLSRQDDEWLSREAVTALWRLFLPQIAAPHARRTLEPGGTDAVAGMTDPADGPRATRYGNGVVQGRFPDPEQPGHDGDHTV
ncbi:ScbR family autoregulator-binding transcription factor [Streptomyces sp. NPDC002911]